MPNVVDLAVALFVLLVAWNGYRAGLLLEIAGLFRVVAGIVVGIRFYPAAGAALGAAFGLTPTVANIGGFLILFLAVEIALSLLYNATLYPLADVLHIIPGLGGVDRLLGMIPAAAQALFWAALALTALLLLPIDTGAQRLITESALGRALVVDLSGAETALQAALGDAGRGALLYVTPPPTATEGTVQLHFPPGLPLSTDTGAEATMLAYVNEQRTQRGLAPLRLDPTLTQVARAHSADMFRRSYFSHEAPDGTSPFDRMHAAGITYAMAGENIAYAPTVAIADTGLMNSPEHRANILRPEFTRIGIGVVSGGLFQEMFTQDFAD